MSILYRVAAKQTLITESSSIGHEFCDFLAQYCPECSKCVAHKGVDQSVADIKSEVRGCFVGVGVAQAPVMLNNRLVGVLECRANVYDDETGGDLLFGGWAAVLESAGFRFDLEALEVKWRQSPMTSRAVFGSYGQLLRLFASHLETLAQTLALNLPPRRESQSAITERAIRFINDNLGESLKIGEIADALNVDGAYLSRVFKADVGLTPSEYLGRRRIQLAKELLLSPLRITDVAYRSGFSSISQFNRSFRKEVGLSPREYRGNMAEKFS